MEHILTLGIFWAFIGGVAYQLYLIIERIQTIEAKRTDLTNSSFYVVIFLNIAISLIIGVLYYQFKVIDSGQYMAAFQVGISSPLLLRSVIEVAFNRNANS